MEPLKTCGCHEDYHDLGVHRPHFQASVEHADETNELATSGAA